MKKLVKKPTKLSRKLGHRRSLLRNLVQELVLSEKIQTTLAKAKTIRPIAEKLITKSKNPSSSAKRQIAAFFYKKEASQKLLREIGPRFVGRPGGYTRIVKLGPRQTDGAEEAVIELVK